MWQMNFSAAKCEVTVRKSGVCCACVMPNLEEVLFAQSIPELPWALLCDHQQSR